MKRHLLWCGALLVLAGAHAQTPGNALKSPEVSDDHHVTFRILAPKAQEVTLTGDWLGSAAPPKLSKDDHGVWSITLGPFEPSIYIYSFTVDGVAIPDPVNPRIKLRARTSASMVEVKDDSPAFWEARDVPHGAVEINWEKSKAIAGETRADLDLHAAGLCEVHAPLSGAVPAARFERYGRRLDDGGERELRDGQSAG